MRAIRNVRRESFGGIIYSENPGFTAFINNNYADKLGIPKKCGLPTEIFSAPLDAHLSLTNKCNLNCNGCYSNDKNSPNKEMDFNLAKSIIDNLSDLGVFTVSLGGGEPLLYSKVFDLAHYIRERNIAPNITTNGVTIEKDMAKLFKIFASIHLSLHCMNDIDMLQKSVENLRNVGITPGLNLLLTSETIPYLDIIFKWAHIVKIYKILILQFKITNKNEEFSYLQIFHEQLRNLYPLIKKLANKYKISPMIDCSLFSSLAIHKPKRTELEFYDVNGCQGGNIYMAIDTDGMYKPCSFWPTTFGNAQTLNAEEWQSNPLLTEFRKLSKANSLCDPCDYNNLCNGGCRLIKEQVCWG